MPGLSSRYHKAHVPSSNLQGTWAGGSQKPAAISVTSGLVVKPNPHGQFVMAILEQRDGGKTDASQHWPLPGTEWAFDSFTHKCWPAVRQNSPAPDKFQVNFQGGN